MRIIRFSDEQGAIAFGDQAADGTVERLDGVISQGFSRTGRGASVAKLLAPLQPTAILAVGLNYRHHANEAGMKIPERPVLFAKGVNTVQNPGDAIELPRALRSDEVDYECELAVVIGRPCKNATRDNALSYVLGYTCANDVSARDWQIRLGGGQWCRGKFFDTFCPLGPCITTTDEIPDPNALRIRTVLNDETVQD